MIKNVLTSAFDGALIASFILIIQLILSGNEYIELFRAVALYTLMLSSITMGLSAFIFDRVFLKLWQQTSIHYLSYLGVASLSGNIVSSIFNMNINLNILQLTIIYFIVWLVLSLRDKYEAKKINETLKKRKE